MTVTTQAPPTRTASGEFGLSRRNLGAELRALWAVAHKEWLHFVRYPTWIVSLFLWPVIFPMAYILGARALAGPDGSGLVLFNQVTGIQDYIGFIVVGTTVWMWQNMVLWDVGFSLREEQMRGTLETNWLSPTWRFSFLIGNTFRQIVVMTVFLSVSALEFGLFYGVRLNGNPWLVLLVFLASIPAIYGLGLTFASLVISAKEAHAFVFLVRGFVMVFCGITYPVFVLPLWMQSIARWLPPTYTISGIRKAALSNADLPALLPELTSLLLFGVFWLAAGFAVFVWMERRARRTGAISQY
jgi:ABC-2 type transport system permease protein